MSDDEYFILENNVIFINKTLLYTRKITGGAPNNNDLQYVFLTAFFFLQESAPVLLSV